MSVQNLLAELSTVWKRVRNFTIFLTQHVFKDWTHRSSFVRTSIFAFLDTVVFMLLAEKDVKYKWKNSSSFDCKMCKKRFTKLTQRKTGILQYEVGEPLMTYALKIYRQNKKVCEIQTFQIKCFCWKRFGWSTKSFWKEILESWTIQVYQVWFV